MLMYHHVILHHIVISRHGIKEMTQHEHTFCLRYRIKRLIARARCVVCAIFNLLSTTPNTPSKGVRSNLNCGEIGT